MIACHSTLAPVKRNTQKKSDDSLYNVNSKWNPVRLTGATDSPAFNSLSLEYMRVWRLFVTGKGREVEAAETFQIQAIVMLVG